MSASASLIVFVKNPVLGKVKTRLAAGIGPAAALRAYEALLRHTQWATAQVPPSVARHVFYDTALPPVADAWQQNGFLPHVQAGSGDLGQRMAAAFAEVWASAPGPALIVGSDCPELRPQHLAKAFALLRRYPAVIGPAKDGGYYLLGLQRPLPSLFEAMPWSSAEVLRLTQQRLAAARWPYALMDLLADVDHEADWRRYAGFLQNGLP